MIWFNGAYWRIIEEGETYVILERVVDYHRRIIRIYDYEWDEVLDAISDYAYDGFLYE